MVLDKTMYSFRMRFVHICVFLVCLSAPITHASDVTHIIHSIPLQNRTYDVPQELVDRHLPLVGKCCAVNEVFVRDANGITGCVASNHSSTMHLFSPLFTGFNRTGVFLPGDEQNEFIAVIESPCDRKYLLYPEKNNVDDYYLLLNGSVYMPEQIGHAPIMLMPGEDYCMDIVPDRELRALVCFPEDKN